MAEVDDGLYLIDGEDAGETPWEFDSITIAGDPTFALEAGAANHGSYGYRYTGTGDSGADDWAYGDVAVDDGTEFWVRFYVRLSDGCAGTGASRGTSILNVGAYLYFLVKSQADSPYTLVTWRASLNGGSSADFATNFSLNTWHKVEIQLKESGAGEGGAKVWIDDDLGYDDMDQNWTGVLSTTSVGNHGGGSAYGLANGSYIDFDDIKANTSGPIGDYPEAGGASIVPLIAQYYRRLRA